MSEIEKPPEPGDLTMGLDFDLNGNVRMEFGKSVTWLSMPPKEAAGLGRLLIRMANASQRAKLGGPPAESALGPAPGEREPAEQQEESHAVETGLQPQVGEQEHQNGNEAR